MRRARPTVDAAVIADGARESRPARAMLSARRVSLDSTVTVQARRSGISFR
ncbi:hypothetical protein BURPS305_1429 [Burkholderia pseudomallei 305]|nr:hypothetical protein BPC006_I1815 [Burkholderia pseudomallei BPC006]EBA46399.1 hypothetical protein BURPS305_1429 [Burkholderia pseudomallei 305]